MSYVVILRNGGRMRFWSFDDLQNDFKKWDSSITMNTANQKLMPIYRNCDIYGVALEVV